MGCHEQRTTQAAPALAALGDDELLSAISILDAALANARISDIKRNSYIISIDHEQESFDRPREERTILSGVRDGVEHRSVLINPTGEELIAAATRLAQGEKGPMISPPALRDLKPEDRPLGRRGEYRNPVRKIFSESQEHGRSRIVYRSAYLQTHETALRILSRKQNIRNHQRRTRAGLIMGAWAAGDIATANVQVSGGGGPKLAVLSPLQLQSVAEQTLAHLHARSAPTGVQEVILCPEAAALLAYHGIAQSNASIEQRENTSLRVDDDPSYGYGEVLVDDIGTPGLLHSLVGENGKPLDPRGRTRFDAEAQLRAFPSHVRVHGGDATLLDLVTKVDQGVLLEGPELCTLNASGDRMALVSSRGREIRGGRFTGRLFSRTLATASLSEFIAETSGLGTDRSTWAFDDSGVPGSAEAPHWLSRARVEAV